MGKPYFQTPAWVQLPLSVLRWFNEDLAKDLEASGQVIVVGDKPDEDRAFVLDENGVVTMTRVAVEV